MIERLACLKQITDLHTGSLTQRIAYEYCARGFLEPGIQRLRDVYRARRDVMLAALQEHCSGVVTWNRPQGGMFIFCTLPEERDAADLLQIGAGARRRLRSGRRVPCGWRRPGTPSA